MPNSSPRGKTEIRRIVNAVPHATMLDIGCGSGTYAKMFPDAAWTGVEVWEPYVEQYGLKKLYERVIVEDARTWPHFDHCDVAICGDVLEHMTSEEAKALIEKLLDCADVVIASIPIGYWPQGEAEGNPHERHVQDNLTHEDIRLWAGPLRHHHQDGEIGVYVWSKKYKQEKFMPKPLKIAVYAIAKNEQQFVERFCESAKDADLIVIADTGSDDDTVKLARKHGALVESISVSPWRFDRARNEAMALLPEDVDVCVSLDLDEVMEPGWREEIERVWTEQTTRLRYFFDWGAGIKFKYEKIHARRGYHWHHPVHEYPMPNDGVTEVWAETDRLLVTHKPDSSKSRGQYLPLLKLSVEEDPRCPRNAFYYARELSFHSMWQEAITACQRYLAMPEATWVNERCYALRVMAKAYAELGNPWAQEAHLLQACAEAMGTREPWCELGMLYYRQERWAQCLGVCERALSIEKRDWVYTCDPAVWGHWPHDLAAVAAWNLGLKDLAATRAAEAVEKSPEDARLRGNLALITGRDEREAA